MSRPSRLVDPLLALAVATLTSGCAQLARTVDTLTGNSTEASNGSAMEPRPNRVVTLQSQQSTLKDFENSKAEQEEWLWCWAACTQMVQRFTANDRRGHPVETQEQIVLRVKGKDQETDKAKIEAASRYEVLCALNPDLQPHIPFGAIWEGLSQRLQANPGLLLNPTVALNSEHLAELAGEKIAPDRRLHLADLLAGYPIVVGLREPDADAGDVGHAWVLYGATYNRTSTVPADVARAGVNLVSGAYLGSNELKATANAAYKRVEPDGFAIQSVQLMDPQDGTAHSLTFADFEKRLMFALSPSVARQQLQQWRGLVAVQAGGQ